MTTQTWTGFPEPTEDQIEHSVVSVIASIMDHKKRNDRPDEPWFVGTFRNHKSPNLADLFANPTNVVFALSVWGNTAAARAASELSEHHGMQLQGKPRTTDMCVYAYTDRYPTIEERRQLPKDLLTVKQKRVFNAIKGHLLRHGTTPTQTQLMKAMGHRSGSTTRWYLGILERKNWITAPSRGQRLQII